MRYIPPTKPTPNNKSTPQQVSGILRRGGDFSDVSISNISWILKYLKYQLISSFSLGDVMDRA